MVEAGRVDTAAGEVVRADEVLASPVPAGDCCRVVVVVVVVARVVTAAGELALADEVPVPPVPA